MNQPPRLQILIVTFGKRIERIDPSGMPSFEGVEYLISCQNPQGLDLDTSNLTSRSDIKLHFSADTGVSRNRNHALDLATADYVLISDDDIIYDATATKKLIETFDADEGIDIVTTHARIEGEHHIYPLDRHNLDKPWPGYSPIAFEIALRRKSLERARLRFAESISIGTPYITCGEENFFFQHCLNADLAGIYRDLPVSTHRGVTTTTHSRTQPGVIRAKGAFMPFARGYLGALIRLPLEAWRSQANFFKALLYLSQGYIYYIRHRKEL